VKRTLPTAIAIGVGVLVLADIFLQNSYLDVIGYVLVDWVAIVAAFALFLGILNLLKVHFGKVARRAEGWPYSLVLILVMWVVLILGLLDPLGPRSSLVQWVFTYVLSPIYATFFSLLAFFAASAAFRAFRLRRAAIWLFLLSALLVLLGQLNFPSPVLIPLAALKDWILAVPGMAGARGIILGVALGTVATGLRLLTGLDRPYSD